MIRSLRTTRVTKPAKPEPWANFDEIMAAATSSLRAAKISLLTRLCITMSLKNTLLLLPREKLKISKVVLGLL